MLRAFLIATSLAGLATAILLAAVHSRGIEPASITLPFAPGDAVKTALSGAMIEFDDATAKGERLKRIAALRRIEALARRLVAQAPSNGEVWGILADIELKKGGSLEQALHYYEMSHLTGRLEWPALRRRMMFAVPVWEQLPQNSIVIAAADVRALLSLPEPHQSIAFLSSLARASKGSPGADALRKAVVAQRPEWTKTFDHQLR